MSRIGGSNIIAVMGGQNLNGWLNGNQVFGIGSGGTNPARAFTINDTGISFSVSQAGTVSLSISIGTLVGTNYTCLLYTSPSPRDS